MAIYTGGMRQEDEARAAAERIAAQQVKGEAGEAKRKGRANLFGKIGGYLAGEGLYKAFELALAGATGGSSLLLTSTIKALRAGGKAAKLAKAIIKGGSMWAGRAGAHQATTGKWDKALPFGSLKTSGQVDKIEAGGKYGYGRKEAATLSQALAEETKSKEDWGTLAGSIGASFASQVAGEKLGGLPGKGGKDFVDTRVPFQETELGGFGVDPNEGGGFMESLKERIQQPNEEYNFFTGEYEKVRHSLSPKEDVPFDLESYAQGGQVPQQQQLMALLSLAQMQQQEETAYSDTALEEEKQQSTIADMFASQGKTLGGNNTQSLSQMLGR